MSKSKVRINALCALIYWVFIMPFAIFAAILIKSFKYFSVIFIVVAACLKSIVTGSKLENGDRVRAIANEIRKLGLDL